MRYRGAVVIPAGTPEASPERVAVELTYGRITEVAILFPAGQSGLVHVKVLYHERQIIPTSPETSFVGDDHLIIIPEAFPIHDLPFEIMLVGWSPDAALVHTVYVDITVEPDVNVAPIYSGSVTLPMEG